MQELISARGIEKSYSSGTPVFGREVEVLTGADLDLYAGEIIGIVGENGSGKSTLMKVLTGVLKPDAGKVEKNGKIGWCPQESLLYEQLTVEENFQLFGSGYGMEESEIRESVGNIADKFGFNEFLDFKIEHLSGGNRQKVNLSVALMHDPEILLLDEPYNGFDWETYLKFWEVSESLVDKGKGILTISHFINDRKQFDKIYKLEEGQLSEGEA